MKFGAQLYTIRDTCKSVNDFEMSMRRISEIGYKSVQVSGIGADITSAQVRKICDSFGLEIAVTHSSPDRLVNDTKALIEEHKILGCKNIGLGYYYMTTLEEIKTFIEKFNEPAKIIKQNGMQFHYHNHSFEFQRFGGSTGFDYIMENTDPDLWHFILDLYWVQHGGKNPVDYIEKLSGRLETVHFKDFTIIDGQQKMAEIMEGNLDWGKIIPACEKSGVQFALIEQDNDWAVSPFESLTTSFNNLKNFMNNGGK